MTSREERVAVGTNFDMNLTNRRKGLSYPPTSAGNLGRCVFWMYTGFHFLFRTLVTKGAPHARSSHDNYIISMWMRICRQQYFCSGHICKFLPLEFPLAHFLVTITATTGSGQFSPPAPPRPCRECSRAGRTRPLPSRRRGCGTWNRWDLRPVLGCWQIRLHPNRPLR